MHCESNSPGRTKVRAAQPSGTAAQWRGARPPAPGGALGGAARRATPSLYAGATMATGNGGDLMDMPDDTFAMVLAAIDQPHAAVCMLATCQRVGEALRAHEAAPEAAAGAPMIVQVQAVSAALRLRDVGEFHLPALELASACGWVQLFPLLVRPSAPGRPFVYRFAATGGHLALLQWARAQATPSELQRTCEWAAQGGHLDLMKWARAKTPPAPWDWRTGWGAARYGHLELLQWARAQSAPIPWDQFTCQAAAIGGHLALLQWARARGAPWDETTCEAAARGGRLRVLQWARAHGAPWDEDTCQAADRGGHLRVLKWARGKTPPAPWNVWTCRDAAGNGHLELLKWARTQTPPAPWDVGTCMEAAGGGHLELLKWARAQTPPAPWDASTYTWANKRSRSELLEWVRAQIPHWYPQGAPI